MSRSGYSSGNEYYAVWAGRVASAIRGKRGQAFFRALVGALDAMPSKRLIVGELETGGEVCALGALGRVRGVDMSKIDPEDPDQVAPVFDIATCLAQEVVYMNDEHFYWHYIGNDRTEYTPEDRWKMMRAWAVSNIRLTPEECNAVEIDDGLPESEEGKQP